MMEASFRPRLQRGPRQRRPSGQPPPLPHHLQGSGAGWLIASIVLTAGSIVVFTHGLRGPAVEAVDSALPHQAMLILGYVRRGALQQALSRRSGGRLHLT